jgi:hypothetical protein
MLSLHRHNLSSPSSSVPFPNRLVDMTEATRSLVASLKPGVNNQVDLALMSVCEAVQLPEPARKTAEAAYVSIAKFLMEAVPEHSGCPAQAYAQGSILQKTTVKPLKRDVFDVDVVMELPWEPNDPVTFLSVTHTLVERWISRDGGEFGAKSATMRDRCIEIRFVGQVFSMDVVPACSACSAPSSTRIKIVDAGRADWKISDPKAFAAWFEIRTRVVETVVKEASFAKAASSGVVHPMPEDEDAGEKAPLRLVIQLAKRARDVFHRRSGEDESQAVPSILLTVIVARSYRGTRNLSAALRDAAADIALVSREANPPRIYNPANPEEAITDKWDRKPESWEAFRRWAPAFLTEVDSILASPDHHFLIKALSATFGEAAVVEAVKAAATSVGRSLDQGSQRVTSAGRVLFPGSMTAIPAITARPTTYFGA